MRRPQSLIQREGVHSQRIFPQQPAAAPETSYSQCDVPNLSFNAKAHAGVARRAGRSPSAARKLPEQQPRSPREMPEAGKPQRGASGGMQGGPRRGRSPITGPALPSPEAAQTTNKKRPPCPQGTEATSQMTGPVSMPLAARRAGGQNNNNEKAPVPAGHKNPLSKDRPL